MGLDMFLMKETYIGAGYEFNEVKGTVDVTKQGESIPINLNRISTITEEVGYWRKANHIHNWFVQNVQGGRDECQRAYVSKEDLEKLLSICKEVLADHSKAPELLPTTEGFFFGGTDYDEYYFQDVQDTINIIEPLLKELEENSMGDVYYQSSW